MTRVLLVALASLLLAAAGPRVPHRTALTRPVPQPLLPLPPPLPTDPPDDLAAPVPDYAPAVPDASTQVGTAWALRIYRIQEFGTGEGFIPGSAYQSPEQRKPMQTPGFIVTVPLQ
jgi:hypothetical protein